MPETNIGSAESSDLTNTMRDYSVESSDTDGTQNSKETIYQNTDWTEDYGYYKKIPELKAAIDTKATWTIGAGIKADEITLLLLGTIKGNGKDSFTSILKNQIKVKTISKDSYAEIIRDDEGILINLKPLNPGSIKTIYGMNGMIKRYEQETSKRWFQFWKKKGIQFKPEDIFHLSHERIADEVHGTRLIDSVKWIILARNEAMDDYKRVMHRNIDPLWIMHLDTDDENEIKAFKSKYDKARASGEIMYVPKGVVVPELVATSANATLNPLTWIQALTDYFFQVVNVPQIIMGNAKAFTDASGKIVYLAYEQNVKAEQLYVEEQVLLQLNLEINLTFPASLQADTISDTPSETDTVEEEPIENATQPNDTTSELEGKT